MEFLSIGFYAGLSTWEAKKLPGWTILLRAHAEEHVEPRRSANT
jgi:hypothetical protein